MFLDCFCRVSCRGGEVCIGLYFCFYLLVFACISLHLLVFASICFSVLVFHCTCLYWLAFACICLYLFVFACICLFMFVFAWNFLALVCFGLYLFVNAGIGLWRLVSRGPWTRARQEIHLASSKINFFPFNTKANHKGSFHYICSVRQIDMMAGGQRAAGRHIVLSYGEYNRSFLGELPSF